MPEVGFEPTTQAFSVLYSTTELSRQLFYKKNSEGMGFEPMVNINIYFSLANWRFRPLSHPSLILKI